MFIGPIIGAIFITYLSLMLSDLSSVWQLYFGLIFIAIVVFALEGIAGLLLRHRPIWRAGEVSRVLRAYVVAAPPTMVVVTGLVLGIEIVARHTIGTAEDLTLHAFALSIDLGKPVSWAIVGGLTLGGFVVARFSWASVARAWASAMTVARAKGHLA